MYILCKKLQEYVHLRMVSNLLYIFFIYVYYIHISILNGFFLHYF